MSVIFFLNQILAAAAKILSIALHLYEARENNLYLAVCLCAPIMPSSVVLISDMCSNLL